MGSPSFGLPTSGNNAPLPIPGNTNPTGTNNGVGFNGASFPNYPMFGAPSNGVISPAANSPIFGTSGMDSLSSGIWPTGPAGDALYKQLSKAYGSGGAGILAQILSKGLYNPQTSAAFLNAMQPGINQGNASILNAFGAEGSRFGSAAALGEGNYLSQVNLNEQQTLASMYENAQAQELGVLSGILPTVHAEQANKGSWIDDLIGGLEIAGGVAVTALSGGTLAPIGGALIGAGAGELNTGINKGTSGGGPVSSPSFGVPMGTNSYGTAPTGGYNYPNKAAADAAMNDWNQYNLDSSAGTSLGGSDPNSVAGYDSNIISNDPGITPIFGLGNGG